ncbi:MAG TPA: type II toxin-antitoxin system VapC family toxin, partial [Edaphobacter sp.]|nr:type II toxin-antitoxin system VapC family toxin [Edaphobacter sp.]
AQVIVHYLLDTNTVSHIAKGKSPAARAQLESLGEEDFACISSITEAELRYGLAKRPGAHALHAAVEALLFKLRILPWGREEAAAYGELRAKLEAAGRVMGSLDMLIAAQAIVIGAVVVTNDKALWQASESGLLSHATVRWATDLA